MANLATSAYDEAMRTVNIGELKNRLSGYLQYVKNGEEIIVRDRSVPVARILPFRHRAESDLEAQLVASGALKLPKVPMDWEEFFSTSAGSVSQELAVIASIESRGDR